MSFYKLLFVSAGLLCVIPTGSAFTLSLPFLKKEAQALGYTLPKPYGFNFSYMHMQQGIAIDSIGFQGIQLTKQQLTQMGIPAIFQKPLQSNLQKIIDSQLNLFPENGKQKSNVFVFRADAWVLPFLNLYVMGGKMTGMSSSSVTFQSAPIPLKGIPILSQKFGDYYAKGRLDNFKLNLKGNLYGGGAIIAGGYKHIFSVIDFNYTKSKLSIIDGTIKTFVMSPRIGYDFQQALPLRVWIGGMYQDVEENLSGDLAKLGLPNTMSMTLYDKNNQVAKHLNIGKLVKNGQLTIPAPTIGKFHVKQHLIAKWNTLLGFQYQINPNLGLIVEGGFGRRKSILANLDVRF